MQQQGAVIRKQGANSPIRTIVRTILCLVFMHALVWTASAVTLAWEPSPDASVTGYRIYYGGTSGVYTNSVDVGNSTTGDVNGLVAGVTYFFVVTAYTAADVESLPSNEVSYTVPAIPVNQPPTLNSLSNLTINEDAAQQTVSLSGIGTGAAGEAQTLTVTASSSNAGLIPNPTITYTSPNATGTLRFTPVADASGTATITVTVSDGQAQNSTITRTFTVTVTAVNDAPTLNALSNVTISEDAAQQTVNLAGIGTGAANESQTLTVTAISSNTGLVPNPTVSYISPNATGILQFTPVGDAIGTATITVTVSDGQAQNSTITRTFTVTVTAVNDAPTLNALSNVTISEDAAQQTVNLAGISTGAANENQTLTVTAISSNTGLVPNPTVSYISPNATGILQFTPVADANGTATITVTVSDGQSQNSTISRTFTVTVNAVNDSPTLNALSNVTINQDATVQTVNLSGIGTGAPNETQTLTVTASSSNTGLIPNPTAAYTSPTATGTLQFTPVAGASGSATITVTVSDGQTQNSTVVRTFTVMVNAVNAAPTLNALSNVTINEDAAQQTVSLLGIGTGAAGETQTLTVTASSSNAGLIPNPSITYTSPNATGTLRFTPVADASGTATITVAVSDGQAQNSTITRTFTVTVNAVNDSPTLSALSNVTINEDAAQQTVSLAGIGTGAANEDQTLTVLATSSNTGLIPNPTFTYTSPNATGTLQFTPVADASGTATITVTVSDGQAQNSTITRTFTVTVNAVNDAPTLNTLNNLNLSENPGLQTVALSGINSGAANESQTLTVTAISSNTGLIPNPTITYTSPNATGTLRFTPVADASGTATITVTVSDGQSQNSTISRTFNVAVNSVNNPPTFNALSNVTINEDAGQQSVSLAGINSGASNELQTLTLTAASSNTGLIPNPTITYTSPNATGTLRFTPVADASGTATITLTLSDGQDQFSRTFTVTVNAVNDSPTLNALSNVTISEDAAEQTISLAGIDTGAANENQTLTVLATSSNTGLIPNPTVTYSSPDATGTLRFTPVADASGTATITVTVSDGQAQNSTIIRTFTVTVNAENDAPTLNTLNNLNLSENPGLQTVALSGINSGAANESQTLTVTATSSNTGLVPNPTITYTSPSATGTLRFTPVADASGTATITVTVSDGQSQNSTISRTFNVTVNSVNRPPAFNALSNITISEDAAQQTVNLAGINSGASNEIQTLTLTAASSNTGLISNPTITYTSPNSTGTLRFTPVADANGTATITVTLSDGQDQFSRTFTVTVNPVNDAPTLNALSNLNLSENSPAQTVFLFGISSGAANENQALTVTASSSNTGLIPNPTINYNSPNAVGTIGFTPVANAGGSATITVTVNDGQASSNTISRSFVVTVNSAPTITKIDDQTIYANTNTGSLFFDVEDLETPATGLAVWASSSNPALVPDDNIVLAGQGTNRSVVVTPMSGQTGVATITITVSDGTANSEISFDLTVQTPPPQPPGNLVVLLADGFGSVVSSTSPQAMVAQNSYTVTAVPAAGQLFAGWSGSVTSDNPKLTFIATPGMVIKANFVPDPFLLVAGTFNGLFFEDDEVRQKSAGSFTLTVTKKGTYSGKLQMGALRYSFSGKLNTKLEATNNIIRKNASSLRLTLRAGSADSAEADKLFGVLSDTGWSSTLSGDRAVFNLKTAPAPLAGNYTLVVPGEDSPTPVKMGDGYGSVRLDAAGRVKFTGSLADGTKVSQSTGISKDGYWPLYVPLYRGNGSVVSWLVFTNQPDSDLAGNLSWIKQAALPGKDKYFTGGFTNDSMVAGSAFVRPIGAAFVINLPLPSAMVAFEGGNLADDFASLVSVAANKITETTTNKLSLKFNTTSGLFSGGVKNPTTGKPLKFGGVVLQKMNSGYGYSLGTNQSSRVTISP